MHKRQCWKRKLQCCVANNLYVVSLAEIVQSRVFEHELCVYKEHCSNEIEKNVQHTHTLWDKQGEIQLKEHEETAILDNGLELHYWDSVYWMIEFRPLMWLGACGHMTMKHVFFLSFFFQYLSLDNATVRVEVEWRVGWPRSGSEQGFQKNSGPSSLKKQIGLD